jgi:predicted component of type VI protein secretion system
MLPLVVQVELVDQHKATTQAYVHSPVRIGRNPLNDLVLNAPYVSQWHAVVRVDEEKSYYVDLGATNPTLVNGQPLAKHIEMPVDEGVDVRIGNMRLHFLRATAPPELIQGVKRESAFSLRNFTPVPVSQNENTRSLDRLPEQQLPPRVQEPVPSHNRPPDYVSLERSPAPTFSERPAVPSAWPPAAVSIPPRTVVPKVGPSDGPPRRRSPRSSEPGFASGPPPRVSEIGPAVVPGRSLDSDSVLAEQFRSAFERLDVYHKAYQYAWSNFVEQIERETQQMTPSEQTIFAASLHQQYPDANVQQGFQKSLKNPQLAPKVNGGPELEDWLKRLTNGLFPPLRASRQLSMAMERVGAILEVFSQGLVELRNTQLQFSQEMGLKLINEESPLRRKDDPRAILAYLLDPSMDGTTRIEELSRLFAEFALHHVALLKATVEGGRSLMQRISPEAIGEDPSIKPDEIEENDGIFARVFPFEARRMWKRYLALYQVLVEEDRFTKELFGRSFARAYYTFTGGRSSKPPTL